MTKDEALKLSLEALDKYGFAPCDKEEDWQGFKRAITAIKEALAKPEPVSYTGNGTAGREADVRPTAFFFQMPKPEQEPVACIEYIPCCTDKTCPKCKATTPPQRTWVGLTAGEILDALISVDEKTVRLPSMLGQFACAIEAKLKEKNT